ncbi:MAG: type II toxin-antitoxin system RelE/ParE family toxin, partial [Gallionella sp.]
MKPVRFLGDSLKRLREFPEVAKQDTCYQLDKVQKGQQPDDYKPMPSIGKGVEEIRVRDETGIYCAIYSVRLADAVYALHAFQKKTQTTPKPDIDIAKERYAELLMFPYLMTVTRLSGCGKEKLKTCTPFPFFYGLRISYPSDKRESRTPRHCEEAKPTRQSRWFKQNAFLSCWIASLRSQ